MPKVSIILPAYNCSRYLPESVASVLAQTFRDFELFIIDDGSTDDTGELVKRYLSDARVAYIRQDHGGLSSARNKGIDNSRGNYIAFIDGDDICVKEKIEKQLRVMERDRNIDVVYSSERYFCDDAPEKSLPSPYEKLSGDLLIFLKRSNFIHISTVMARHSSIEGIRFDPFLKSHEDWDFFLKLAEKRKKYFYLAEELSLIRVRKDSMTTASPIMDSSRTLVGERAQKIWVHLKKESRITTPSGIAKFVRRLTLKTRAWLLGFPASPRFNRPLPFREVTR